MVYRYPAAITLSCCGTTHLIAALILRHEVVTLSQGRSPLVLGFGWDAAPAQCRLAARLLGRMAVWPYGRRARQGAAGARNATPVTSAPPAPQSRSGYVDHDDRSAAGRNETGLPLRQDALDPGFHDVHAGAANPDGDADGAGVSCVRFSGTCRPAAVHWLTGNYDVPAVRAMETRANAGLFGVAWQTRSSGAGLPRMSW